MLRAGVKIGLGFCLALAGCSVPRGAALQSEVLRSQNAATPEFAQYQVDSALLPVLASWPSNGKTPPREWIAASRGALGQIIAPGDSVAISVWENSGNALLTAPGAPSANLQNNLVSAEGNVFVPYVGTVKVSGMSPEHARETIQARLEPLIPAAQVQLAVQPGRQNSVDIVSGVSKSGTYPMLDRSMTVLGLISQGGGVLGSIKNPQVRLLRGSKSYAISLERLLREPGLDTTLRAGDKLVVENDDRYFLALGASGNEELVPFGKDSISALDAVTIAGGLLDLRANPQGVLVLREYPASAVETASHPGPSHTRVVFNMDLTSADGLFSAGNFPIVSGDLVLATESPLVSARTVLGLIGAMIGVNNALGN
jgi:polysaccharide export outer membrane protein